MKLLATIMHFIILTILFSMFYKSFSISTEDQVVPRMNPSSSSSASSSNQNNRPMTSQQRQEFQRQLQTRQTVRRNIQSAHSDRKVPVWRGGSRP